MDTSSLSDRALLRALFRAATPVTEQETADLTWRPLRFEPATLHAELSQLTGSPLPGLESALAEFADHYQLRAWRVDDVTLPLLGVRAHMPRSLVGEALGPFGAGLLPTRRRALFGSMEAARELVYLGASQSPARRLPSPVQMIRELLGDPVAPPASEILFQEITPIGDRDWTPRELLQADPDFHRPLTEDADLVRFERLLRRDPLDGTMVAALRDFFSRRITVGVRDTVRWTLGGRHPWFDWDRAREIIETCFRRWGDESFVPRLIRIYTHDLDLADDQLTAMLERNREIIRGLAAGLSARLAPALTEALAPGVIQEIAAATLDYRHDHPDFDTEATGDKGSGATARFVGRAALDLARGLIKKELKPRLNRNFGPYLEATGLARQWMGGLADGDRASLFEALEAEVDQRAAAGLLDGYRRPPMMLFTFYESAAPRPREGEQVIDSFRLSQARAPQHAVHFSQQPEITEKLVVFFTLVLRHYLDTGYVPDLMPTERLKEFTLLGLWGHNSPNLVVNLYQDQTSETVRSELRFVGRSQLKHYRPDEDGLSEAALARMAASQLDPLILPTILRALAGFVMTVEEREQGRQRPEDSRTTVARHAVEVARETLRLGIRGTLIDLATVLEVLVDDSANLALRWIDRAERLSARLPARSRGSLRGESESS